MFNSLLKSIGLEKYVSEDKPVSETTAETEQVTDEVAEPVHEEYPHLGKKETYHSPVRREKSFTMGETAPRQDLSGLPLRPMELTPESPEQEEQLR